MSHPRAVLNLHDYARLVLAFGAGADADDFPAAIRRLLARPDLADTMDAFVARAHDRMPAGDDDGPYWRMLYIDAAVLKVLARASAPRLSADAARECISTLDRAIIVAGAANDDARRDYVVHDVIRHLQSYIPWRPPSTAVFAKAAPASHTLPAGRRSVRSVATLPSIVAAHEHWSRAPFVLRGYADHWPAMRQPRQWASLEYLFSVSGPARTVPVEVGNDYTADDWSQKLVAWEDFLSSLDTSVSTHGQHQDRVTYLAQYSLLAQFPRLREDIILPDIVYACLDAPAYEPPADVIVNAWLGPKGTVSPAHTDAYFNCYVQVVGRKTVWLAPPSVSPAMYPYRSSPSNADRSHKPAANATSPHLSNTSRVDVFSATPQESFPLFWDAVPEEASCVTLSPGDLLFIPPGWWHAMRSEDVSFSVSMWH